MRKLAPLLCAAALTLSLALPAGAYYASNEDGTNEPGGPMTSISVTTEPVSEPELPSLGGLTPDGNLALIDDILDGSYYSSEEIGEGGKMQFVTVETKSGNVFYLVIDHSTGDVYFLNLVDESDLLALLEDEGYEAECDCEVKCEAGAVNTDCPVCRTDLKGCKGEEPEPTPTPTPVTTTEPEDEGGFNAAAVLPLPIALIILLGAAGVYYILKARKKKPDTSGDTDLDDYEFPEDDEEDEAK